MLIDKFREAGKRRGRFCPKNNELRVRRGNQIYRFIYQEDRIRFVAPGQSEMILDVSFDTTVAELRRGITEIIQRHSQSTNSSTSIGQQLDQP